ncbi:unnamed protein product [Blepharisma stoltei]|uniref:Uncharacterized protein n=1 Tax=Blepharisma stoltei TaxID=1481888 RepID=A0AAU9IHL5_9CILI|nr:unnamed protein product [Blepharisma stoltei]
MIYLLYFCILTYTISSGLSMKGSQNSISSDSQVFYNPDTGEIITEEERQILKSQYIAVVDNVVAAAVSDYNAYGFYSVTGKELNDDIQALIKLYKIMADDENVVINNIVYDKDSILKYIEVDEDLATNFQDNEVLVIKGSDSEFMTEEELMQLEEEII